MNEQQPVHAEENSNAAPSSQGMLDTGLNAQSAAVFRDRFLAIEAEVKKEILTPEGQGDFVRDLLIGLFARGHVLLEGRPGLGKTMLVRALGTALGLRFGRVQFTPDLMPSDITGTTVLQTDATGQIYQEFRAGPVFANIVLADEINRASPKTQAALLEVMAERQLTVAGVTYRPGQDYDQSTAHDAAGTGLDQMGLFHVLATQNPIEQEGTYPLPEAQLDRFLFKLIIPSPDRELLTKIVAHTTGGERADTQQSNKVAGLSFSDIQQMQSLPPMVETAPSAVEFAVGLCAALNPLPESPSPLAEINEFVSHGPSPRGAQALILAAKTLALIAEGDRPVVDKALVAQVAHSSLRHRVALNYRAVSQGLTSDDLIQMAINHLMKPDVELGQ